MFDEKERVSLINTEFFDTPLLKDLKILMFIDKGSYINKRHCFNVTNKLKSLFEIGSISSNKLIAFGITITYIVN